MEDLNPKNSLYREILFEHYKNPKNKGLIKNSKVWTVKNPTCGDEVSIQFEMDETGKIKNVFHKSIGCLISTSSTSIMTQLLNGKSVDEAIYMAENFINMIKGIPYDKNLELKDGVVFEKIGDYPARYKCAAISWEIALAVLKKYKNKEIE